MTDDFAWGSLINKTTNEFNGMVGKIQRGDADICIGSITITALRETAIDFTDYYHIEYLSIFGSKPSPNPSWMSLLLPYGIFVWISIIITIVIVCIVNWSLTKLFLENESLFLVDSIYFTVAIFLGKPLTKKNILKMTKMAYVIWCLMSFMIGICNYFFNLFIHL